MMISREFQNTAEINLIFVSSISENNTVKTLNNQSNETPKFAFEN